MKITEAKRILKAHGIGSLVTHPAANAKLAKSVGYYNVGISLAPAKASGFQVCVHSTPLCRRACLANTGRAEFTPAIQKSRIARTRFLMQHRQLFRECLFAELDSVDRKAKKLGIQVAMRPNVLSDILWHKIMPELFERYNHWQFYAYTKWPIEAYKDKPDNLHITYSYNENTTEQTVRNYIEQGINVAVAFYHRPTMKPAIPETWHGFKVIDGDASDLRFLDPQGVIVGLKAKLPKRLAKRIETLQQNDGFFVGWS